MPREGTGPDFIEALARGLDVIGAFGPGHPVMSLSEVASATGWRAYRSPDPVHARVELGYARPARGLHADPEGPGSSASPICGPREALGRGPAAHGTTGRADQRVLLDRAARGLGHRLRRRVAVPKIVRRRADRHPLPRAADLTGEGPARRAGRRAELARCSREPTRSGLVARWQPDAAERDAELREVRAGAGRSPTNSSRSASDRSPCRCATGRGGSSPGST